MDLDALSPMYDAGSKHFYVNELTELQDQTLVIPFRWVISHGVVHAESWRVELDDKVSVLNYI